MRIPARLGALLPGCLVVGPSPARAISLVVDPGEGGAVAVEHHDWGSSTVLEARGGLTSWRRSLTVVLP